MHGHEVRLLEQPIQLHRLHFEFLKQGARHMGRVDDDSEAESFGFWDKGTSDVAKANKPQGLSGQPMQRLQRIQIICLRTPFATFDVGNQLIELPGTGEDKCHSVVRDFLQAVIGVIGNTDTFFRGGGYIHIVITNAGKRNQSTSMQIPDYFVAEDVARRYSYSQCYDSISLRTGRDEFFLTGTEGLINFSIQAG